MLEALGMLTDLVWGTLRLGWPILAGVAAVIAFLVAILALATPYLKEDDCFYQIRDWALQPGRAARYRGLITAGLGAAGRFYGETLRPSWRGYGACLVIAFAYPTLLWLLAWGFDGPGVLAGDRQLDDTTPTWRRFLAVPVLLGVGLGFAWYWRNFDRWSDRIAQGVSVALGRAQLHRILPDRAVVAVVAVVAGVAVGAAVALGTVGTVGAVVGVGGVGAVDAVVYALLFLLLPFANAALDHLSVQVSRLLLADLIRRAGPWQWLVVAGHVLLDIIAAALFLVGLAILLPVVLQAANLGFVGLGWPVVEWRLYLDAARADPFGAGLTVTGMLATTLIPTVLHLLAAGVALGLPVIGGRRIEVLADQPSTTLLDRAGFVLLAAVPGLLSWATLCVIAIVLWHAAGLCFGPLGGHLAALAETAGGWVPDPPAAVGWYR